MRHHVSRLLSTFAALPLMFLSLSVRPASPQGLVAEPKSGAKFAAKEGDMSLLGVGLRARKFGFVQMKLYAVGLYVADSALAGPLAKHKGNTTSAAFYKDLIEGDFPKQVIMRFVSDVGRDRAQETMREALEGADKEKLNLFVNYFPEVRKGDESTLRWAKGGVLEIQMSGLGKPPIADRAFARAVFGIWLRDKPVQEDIKRDLVARAEDLLK